jgi:hypothetical protein
MKGNVNGAQLTLAATDSRERAHPRVCLFHKVKGRVSGARLKAADTNFAAGCATFALRTRLICRAEWLLFELGFDFW